MINEIEQKSESLFKFILQKKGQQFEKERWHQLYEDSFNILPNENEIDESIIVLGINPSAEEFTNDNPFPNPCYLHYVNSELKDELIKKIPNCKNIITKWGIGKDHLKFTYFRYFGPIYNLFNTINFYPSFVSATYNRNWLEIYNLRTTKANGYKLIPNDHIDIIQKLENPDCRKFIFFLDLLPFKDKNSNNVKALFDDEEVQRRILEILQLKFKLLKPKLVIQHWKGIPEKLKIGIRSILKEFSQESELISTSFIPYMLRRKETQIQYAELKQNINDFLSPGNHIICSEKKWEYIKP